MRITNKMLSNNFLTDVNRNLNQLKTLQEQMTSGKEIRRPSDDPFRVARSMQLHTDIGINKQYNKNIEDTINFLDITDTALGQGTDVLQRIHELLISAGNAAYGSSERQAIKDEINQKVGEFGQIMNTSFDGKYIFGGTRATTKPVYVSGAPIYTGGLDLKIEKPDTEAEAKKWQNTKLNLKTSGGKDVEIDLSVLTGKTVNLDTLASEINKQIQRNGVTDVKVISNLKEGKIQFINESGKELEVRGEKKDTASGKPDVPDILNKSKKISPSTIKNKGSNTRLNYNDRDSNILKDPDQERMLGEKLTVEISQGVVLDYNVTSKEIFEFNTLKDRKDPSKGDKSINVMDLFYRIENHLDEKDAEGNKVDKDAIDKLLNEDLTDIKSAMDNMLKIRSEVGAKENRMDSARDKNKEQNFNLTEILSTTEDIDITEKTMEYAVMQSVYLASLQTSAKILQPTLMDYLR